MGRFRAGFAAVLFSSCRIFAQTPIELPDSPHLRIQDLQASAMPGAAPVPGLLESAAAPWPFRRAASAPAKVQAAVPRDETGRTRYAGSTYVPVDSWIYPALERLTAMGYVHSGSLAMRPITRVECARQIAEANTIMTKYDRVQDDVAVELLATLGREFAHETKLLDGERNAGSTFEGAYARYSGLAGSPLRDSFHFSQTIYNDFGRPYGQGSNVIAGVSGHAERGIFAAYVRTEFQHGAAMANYSASAQKTIVAFDQLYEAWQLAPGTPVPPVFNFNPDSASRPRMVEGYVALNLDNWQISAGQQSVWYGPDRTTSLILSNNAAAMPMLRVARVKPLQLPSLLRYAGPFHFDMFLAREGGVHYVGLTQQFLLHGTPSTGLVPTPLIFGASFSIKPFPNFELTLAHTVIFAGYGRPLTLRTFIHTFNIYGNAQVKDPGKRVTEFNFSYNVPGFRHRMLVYGEGMAWDNPAQGHFTERFALSPGVYVAQVPYVRKLDLRLEGVYTALPGIPEVGYFYANAHYPQGYTNYGQVLGSWVGRQGRGGSGTSTYWLTPRTKVTATFRRMLANRVMLQGGNMTDVSGGFTWLVNPRIELSTVQQYEHWRFPVIDAASRTNFSTTFQVQWIHKPRM